MSLAEAERTTLREALDRYEQEISRKKKGAKLEIVRIRYWMNHELAIRSLAKIRSVDIAKWCDAEAQREVQSEAQSKDKKKSKTKTKRYIKPNTINNHLILLSRLFNVARRKWGIKALKNPVQNIERPKSTPGRERGLVGDEEVYLLGVPLISVQ